MSLLKFLFPPKLVCAEYDFETEILKISYSDGSSAQYKGNSTVWRTYPMMKRCGTFTESRLSDIYKYIKEHGNPYPTAHENKKS